MGAPDAKARERLCSAAFDAAPWPALLLSTSGRMQAANEAAEVQFGAALSLLRYGLKEATPPGSPLVELFVRAVSEGGVLRQTSVMVEIGGAPPFEADVAVAPISNETLLLALYVEPLGLRQERASDALRSVAGLGRTLAHEIKNPLSGIRGAAQLLRLGASEDDAPLAQVIVDEVDRIRRLVEQVEVFSDHRRGAHEAVNIHKVLDRVRTLMASGSAAGVRFMHEYDPSLPMVLGDEDQLIQIFLNLAKNATEAALERRDGQGEVMLSTLYRPGARVRGASSQWSNAPLEVRVQDNGPGIAPELRHRLFDAFATTKSGGMGLGLTLAAKLVDANDGLIEFSSEPGRTVFHVRLPLAPASPSGETASS